MTDVFISYSRSDIAFAKLLHEALNENGLETWIDWQDIPPSADWLAEIYEAIEQADTFVFIISETSLESEICGYEIAHASKHHKRLIPIVINEIEAGAVPKELSVLNWIFFEATGEKFAGAVQDLVTAITVDQAWLKAHTRYENRALEWEKKGREGGALLRGDNLTEAENWLAGSAGKDPQPTPLQTQYILASRQESTRRQRRNLTFVAIALVVAITLGIFAWTQRNVAISEGKARATAQMEAIDQRNVAVEESNARATAQSEAESESQMRATAQSEAQSEAYARATQQAIAEEQRDIAIEGLSRNIGIQASRLLDESQSLSLLLSLEALHLDDTLEARSSLLSGITHAGYLEKILFSTKRSAECVAFSPDGQYLATCHPGNSELGSVLLWDAVTGLQIGVAGPPGRSATHLVFSPDGKTLAIINASDHTILLWNWETGTIIGNQIQLPEGIDPGSMSIAFHPTEAYYAVVSDQGIVEFRSNVDQSLFELLSTAETPVASALAFTPDGKQLFVGSSEKPIIFWDLDERDNPAGRLEGTEGAYYLAFNADGDRLAYMTLDPSDVEGRFFTHWYVMDLHNDQIIEEGTLRQLDTKEFGFSMDGQYVAVSDRYVGNYFRFHRLGEENARKDIIIREHVDKITSLSISPKDLRLASTSQFSQQVNWKPRGTAFLWDMTNFHDIHNSSRQDINIGSLTEVEYAIRDLEFNPAHDNILAASLHSFYNQGDKIEIWDLEAGTLIQEIELVITSGQGVNSLVFSSDGNFVFGTDKDKIRTWDFQSGQQLPDTISAGQGTLNALDTNPNGDLFSAGDDATIRKWDVKNLTPLPFLLTHPSIKDEDISIVGLDVSPDGKILASISNETAVLWDLKAGDPTPKFLDTPGDDVQYKDRYGDWTQVLFHPDGNLLAATRKGGAIDFWSIPEGIWIHQILYLNEDYRKINQIDFSPDGQLMAGGTGGYVYLWGTQSYQRIGDALDFPLVDGLFSRVAFSPSGDFLASSNQGYLHFWSLDIDQWKQSACKIANRNLTPKEWQTYLGDLPYGITCPQYPSNKNP